MAGPRDGAIACHRARVQIRHTVDEMPTPALRAHLGAHGLGIVQIVQVPITLQRPRRSVGCPLSKCRPVSPSRRDSSATSCRGEILPCMAEPTEPLSLDA